MTTYKIRFVDDSVATVPGKSHQHACRRAARVYGKTVLDWRPIAPKKVAS